MDYHGNQLLILCVNLVYQYSMSFNILDNLTCKQIANTYQNTYQ